MTIVIRPGQGLMTIKPEYVKPTDIIYIPTNKFKQREGGGGGSSAPAPTTTPKPVYQSGTLLGFEGNKGFVPAEAAIIKSGAYDTSKLRLIRESMADEGRTKVRYYENETGNRVQVIEKGGKTQYRTFKGAAPTATYTSKNVPVQESSPSEFEQKVYGGTYDISKGTYTSPTGQVQSMQYSQVPEGTRIAASQNAYLFEKQIDTYNNAPVTEVYYKSETGEVRQATPEERDYFRSNQVREEQAVAYEKGTYERYKTAIQTKEKTQMVAGEMEGAAIKFLKQTEEEVTAYKPVKKVTTSITETLGLVEEEDRGKLFTKRGNINLMFPYQKINIIAEQAGLAAEEYGEKKNIKRAQWEGAALQAGAELSPENLVEFGGYALLGGALKIAPRITKPILAYEGVRTYSKAETKKEKILGATIAGLVVIPTTAKISRALKARGDVIVADTGELVPLKERLSQVDKIIQNQGKEIETITSKRSSRVGLTNKPMEDIDYTYGHKIQFGTYKVGMAYPTSEYFLKGNNKLWKTGIVEITNAKVQSNAPNLLKSIRKDLLKEGVTSEQKIEKLYSLAKKEANELREPIATISPKRMRGFAQSEQEIIKIMPERWKQKKLNFAGWTERGNKIYTDKSIRQNLKDFITSKVRKKQIIGSYWGELAKDKYEYLKGKEHIKGEYYSHGKAHLLPMGKYNKYYPYHDITKVSDIDSFSKFEHGMTAYKLWKQKLFPDKSIYKLPYRKQRLIARAFAGHTDARFNLGTLLKKRSSTDLYSDKGKQLKWSIEGIKNPYLQDIATLDRLDLTRFGLKIDWKMEHLGDSNWIDRRMLSEKALKRLFENKEYLTSLELSKKSGYYGGLAGKKDLMIEGMIKPEQIALLNSRFGKIQQSVPKELVKEIKPKKYKEQDYKANYINKFYSTHEPYRSSPQGLLYTKKYNKPRIDYITDYKLNSYEPIKIRSSASYKPNINKVIKEIGYKPVKTPTYPLHRVKLSYSPYARLPRGTTYARVPTTPKKDIPKDVSNPFRIKRKRLKSLGAGFDLFLMRKGKPQVVARGLTKEAALDIGTRKTLGSLRATYGIRRSRLPAKEIPTGKEFFRFKSLFRRPSRKSKYKRFGEVYIQKATRVPFLGTGRLTTRGEKSEIQLARKMRGMLR